MVVMGGDNLFWSNSETGNMGLASAAKVHLRACVLQSGHLFRVLVRSDESPHFITAGEELRNYEAPNVPSRSCDDDGTLCHVNVYAL